MDALKPLLCPIHKEGYPFIGLFAFGTLILALFSAALGWIGVLLTLWCVYFFRDPTRVSPQREGLILSPADGVVQKIDRVSPPRELNMGDAPRTRIAVFMNVFNVHVNRSPAKGEVTGLYYYPGKFLNASLDKASEENERQMVKLKLENGKEIAFVQIAGLVARRIVCGLTEGRTLTAGERFGIIRFGSRVDVYLPEGVEPLVIEGQTAVAGETVLADHSSSEPARTGQTW